MPPAAATSEFTLIDRLRERLGVAGRERIELGIGDDAALWRSTDGATSVVCCDTLIAGRHFPDDADAGDIGWKTLAVNLSDLAAMGAEPVATLLALSLPSMPSAPWIDGFCDGWAALARTCPVALIGGDTTRGPVLALTVTCIGELPHGTALRRDGARVGDGIYVSGTLGDAAAGLALWPHRRDTERASAALFARFNRPQPRLALGRALRGLATSAIDVSDGLVADLDHVLAASAVGARVEVDRLPMSPDLREAVAPDTARRHALSGGDDYELCFTVPAEREPALCEVAARTSTRIARIGTITAGSGVILVDRHGQPVDASVTGWDHFA